MEIQLLEILKWIGIVLAAGFIGYFGRYLAMLIIERIHKRKAQPTPTTEPATEKPTSPANRLEEDKLKLEKKKAKLEAKKAKKEPKE